MATLFPPPVPDLNDMLTGPDPRLASAFSKPAFMPSLKSEIDWPGDEFDVLDPGPQEPRFQDVYAPPDFLWRRLDRAQGRYIVEALPDELLAALRDVAEKVVDPTNAHGNANTNECFGTVNSLLSFFVDHVIRNEERTNRRNTRFAPDSRRAYSFRLPSRLKQFLEILRPVVINPYTGQSFANVSQMIVFCVHVFVMTEPWTMEPGSDLWRENRASSRPPPKSSRSADGTLQPTEKENEFSRVEGMTQIHVRIDSGFFDQLARAVEILSPVLARQLKYKLTMSGFWLTATIWASRSIDWGATPVVVRDFPEQGISLPIDWREQAPQGLLLGR